VAAREVTGRVTVDGSPVSGEDVLVFSEPARRLAGAAVTDDDGRFRVRADGEEPLVLLAKVRAPVCSLEAVPLSGSGSVEVDVGTASGFAELSGTTEELEPPLTVRIDPAALEGVPDWLIPLAKQRREGVFEGSYCEVPAAGGAFRVRLRRGDYRLRGDRFVDGPVGPGGATPAALVVTAVSGADGAGDAPGDPYGGFRLTVDGDVSVRLSVTPEG
jgi:hypothetical protein